MRLSTRLLPYLVTLALPTIAHAQSSAAFPEEPEPAPPSPAPAPSPSPPSGAQTAPPSAVPVPVPAPASEVQQPVPATAPSADPVWRAEYADAREELLSGNFEKAARMFHALAARTQVPHERALASELAVLASQWDTRHVVLVTRDELGDSPLTARARNERTTDEISILYVNSVAYGLGSGLWLAAQTEPDSAAGGVLPALALGGAAAGAVALADNARPFRYGVPASIVSGMYIGLEEGLVWALWNQARSSYYDEWEGKTVATVIWGSATVGALAGGIIGSTAGTTPGRASYVGSAALWGGMLTGFITAAFASDENDGRDDAALLAGALGLNAGAVVGALTAGTVSPSIARVRFLDLGGVAGGLVAGGLYVSANDDFDDESAAGFFGVTGLGMAGGLGLAWALTNNMAPDRGSPSEADRASVTVRPNLTPVKGGSVMGLSGTF